MKLPRDVSGGEAVRALRRLGFQVVRQEGSHIRMSKGAVRLTVPNHKTILPKTLQSVLRQAGVSVEDFWRRCEYASDLSREALTRRY